MAVTGKGFDGTLTESDWALMAGPPGVPDQQVSGANSGAMYVQPSPSALTASVWQGTYNKHGILTRIATTDATVSFTNPGTGSRWDAVCILLDWTTNSASIVVVQGGSTPVVPWASMEKLPGTKVHVPLSLVKLTAGSAAPTDSHDLREGVWVLCPIQSPFQATSAADTLRRKIMWGQIFLEGRVKWLSGPLNEAIALLPLPDRGYPQQIIGYASDNNTFSAAPLRLTSAGELYIDSAGGTWTPGTASYIDMHGSYWLKP